MTALFIAAWPHAPDRAAAEIVALAGKVSVKRLFDRAENMLHDGIKDEQIRLGLLALAPVPPDYAATPPTDLTAQQKSKEPEAPPGKYASVNDGTLRGYDPEMPQGYRDKRNRRKGPQQPIAAAVEDDVYDW
jgi:hypothetical protein